MTIKDVNKYTGFVVLFFIVFWIGRSIYKNYQFKGDYKITIGRVNGIASSGWKSSGDYSLLYDYTINGIRYTANSNYNLCDGLSKDKVGSLVINKFFPVAYSVKDVTKSVIIITQKEATIFNYVIPDSLLSYDSLLTCK
jgi:hypothetical protein